MAFPYSHTSPVLTQKEQNNKIVLFPHQIRVYHIHTRQCVRTYNVDLHDAILAMSDPEDKERIVVFTPLRILHINIGRKNDGLLPIVAHQTIQPAVPALKEVFHSDQAHFYAVNQMPGGEFGVWRIAKETATSEPMFVLQLGPLLVLRYAVSRNRRWLAAVAPKSVTLYDLALISHSTAGAAIMASQRTFDHQYSHIFCAAVSDNGTIAVGLAGTIAVVHTEDTRGNVRLFKWHQEPPQALTFTEDGNYLLSGGKEKVLVQWNVGLGSTYFLPRLAGEISLIFVDKLAPEHYVLRLGAQTVVFSAADLVSRLAVVPPVAAEKSVFAVDPASRHLYISAGPNVQAFDLARGELAFVQHIAPQVSIGRVREEARLADPQVDCVCFSADGRWMATFDSMPRLDIDNLLLKNDVSFALKFWAKSDKHWDLVLKVVDPHGAGVAVGCLVWDQGFLSVDELGGVRSWRAGGVNSGNSDKSEPATVARWSLRRSVPPAFRTPQPVSAAWAPDHSLLIVTHGHSTHAYDRRLTRLDFPLPAMDSPIKASYVLAHWLVLVLARLLLCYDLVSATATECQLLLAGPNAHKLISADPHRNILAVALGQKISLFSPQSVTPVHQYTHNSRVISVVNSAAGFVFLDAHKRTGVLACVSDTKPDDDLAAHMDRLLLDAQAAANVLYSRPVSERTESVEADSLEKWTAHRGLDAAALLPVFANVDGVSMASLFERVVRAVQ